MKATNKDPRARVSMFIHATPSEVYQAFVQPAQLKKFWLSEVSAPLSIGRAVHWKFFVKGAEIDATATEMEDGAKLAWDWSDGSRVSIALESLDGGTAITLVNDRLKGKGNELVEAALNATEGFAIVLADLKTTLELGQSAGLTKAKAHLIALRA